MEINDRAQRELLNNGSLNVEDLIALANHYGVILNSISSMYEFERPTEGCHMILIHPTPKSNGHWVGLLRFGDHVIYHDTYGCAPPERVQEECRGLILSWTLKEIQDLRSNYCGHYIINWFLHVCYPRLTRSRYPRLTHGSYSDNPYIETERYLLRF